MKNSNALLLPLAYVLLISASFAQNTQDTRARQGVSELIVAAFDLVKNNQAVVEKILETSSVNDVAMCAAVGEVTMGALKQNPYAADEGFAKVHAMNYAVMLLSYQSMEEKGLISKSDRSADRYMKMLRERSTDALRELWPSCDKNLTKVRRLFDNNQLTEFLLKSFY